MALFFLRLATTTLAAATSGGADPTSSMASFAARSLARASLVAATCDSCAPTVRSGDTETCADVVACISAGAFDRSGGPPITRAGDDGAEIVTVVGMRVASAASTAAFAAASIASIGIATGPAEETDTDPPHICSTVESPNQCAGAFWRITALAAAAPAAAAATSGFSLPMDGGGASGWSSGVGRYAGAAATPSEPSSVSAETSEDE